MTRTHALIAGLAAALLSAAPLAAAAAAPQRLHVATDNAEVLQVGGKPAVVLIANPKIADVVVEQEHLIFVIGKQPGETRLFVYGAGGKPLLERDVVVVPPRDRAVTITRDIVSTDYSCDPRCVALGPVPLPAGGTAGQPSTPTPSPIPAAPAAPAAAAAVAGN